MNVVRGGDELETVTAEEHSFFPSSACYASTETKEDNYMVKCSQHCSLDHENSMTTAVMIPPFFCTHIQVIYTTMLLQGM